MALVCLFLVLVCLFAVTFLNMTGTTVDKTPYKNTAFDPEMFDNIRAKRGFSAAAGSLFVYGFSIGIIASGFVTFLVEIFSR